MGTSPRATLQVSQVLDRWATLGMPLLVLLGIAANEEADPLARRPTPVFKVEQGATDGDAMQMRYASSLIRMLLAKQFVHAIVWDGWDDTVAHLLPHSGLITPQGTRPLLEYFKRLKRDLLA